MSLNFNKQAQKGNQFLNLLAKELGSGTDQARAGRVLRSVFKALRDHLTLEENFQLISQLPMALKGIYVDAWMPSRIKEAGRRKIDFVQEVLAYDDKNLWPRVDDIEIALKGVRAVFRTLKRHISDGEFKDMEAILPRHLKDLLRESISPPKLTIKRISERII